MSQNKKHVVAFLLMTMPLLVLFQNCANNYKLTEQAEQTTFSNTPGQIQTVLKTMQPALAVRGLACLMCHADIRANVITDFGYGNAWFMGGTTVWDESNIPQQSWYGNDVDSWQTAKQIVGTVFVPKANVTPTSLTMLSTPPSNGQMSLADFLMTPYTPKHNYDGNTTAVPVLNRVTPAHSGDPKVAEVPSVKIRAPNENDIKTLDVAFYSGPIGSKRHGFTDATGLVVQNGTGGSYVTNTSDAINCADGDILVNGTLLLQSLKINAANGCRIYVLGSVFIQGGITYGSGANENLQITSTRAIVMGISVSRLQARLTDPGDRRNLELEELTYDTLAPQVVADATVIGAPLKDAQDDYAAYGTVGKDTSGINRSSIDYTGLLLNAPLIHSRYVGSVKGTIVAEAALFALGEFNFQFDPVFTETNVFPILTVTVLQVK